MLSMASREARYDRATDWYVGFARDWAAEARPFLESAAAVATREIH